MAPQSPAIRDYLEHRIDPGIAHRLATQSNWPASHSHQGPRYCGPVDGPGTSLLVSSSDCTRRSGTPSQDLPGLTTGGSAATRSVSTSIGQRQLNRQRILEQDAGGALVVPPNNEPRVLECPFHQLPCSMTPMTLSKIEDWISHSLEHFEKIPPPNLNKCCFCSDEFKCPTQKKECSWRERMRHVAMEHHQHGDRLATARPDFELFTFLWNNKLISDPLYKELKVHNEERSRRLRADASPPARPHDQLSMVYSEAGGRRQRPRRDRVLGSGRI